MRIRKTSGKYSGRAAKESGKGKCRSCTYEHDSSRRCPAEGRKCHKCQEEGHFRGSTLCKATGWRATGKKEEGTRHVEEEEEETESSDDTEWVGKWGGNAVKKKQSPHFSWTLFFPALEKNRVHEKWGLCFFHSISPPCLGLCFFQS